MNFHVKCTSFWIYSLILLPKRCEGHYNFLLCTQVWYTWRTWFPSSGRTREVDKPGDPVPFSIHEQDRATIRENIIEAIIHAVEPVRYGQSIGRVYFRSMSHLWLSVYANYIGPSVMTDANCEGFPICDDRITERDRCVIKIIGIHWAI